MKFRWDGGFIMVSWDGFDEGVEWYVTHLGWKCLDKVISSVGKKAFLKMPKSGVVTLKSFDSTYEHLQKGQGDEGHVRLCFETGNIEKMIRHFNQHNISYSEPRTLQNGMMSLDFYAYENARLTVYENYCEDEQETDALINGFGEVNTLIGVTNVKKAVEWYTNILGFTKVSENEDYAHLQTEDAYFKHILKKTLMDNIFIEKVDSPVKGNPSVRTYFDIRPDKFLTSYNMLIKNGVSPSQIAGDPQDGWGGFHFYDPDGNQINIWSYQLV